MSNAPVDIATMLKNQVIAQREKSTRRVTRLECQNYITGFLNSDESYRENVHTSLYGAKANARQVTARLRSIIKENGLDELVGVTVYNDTTTLVKLV